MIIGETSLCDFMANKKSCRKFIKSCDVIHFIDGLINKNDIENVLNILRKESLGEKPIKISMSYRNYHQSHLDKCLDKNTELENFNKLKNVIDFTDYIELNSDIDLEPEILSIIPPQKRIISCRIKPSEGDIIDSNSFISVYKKLRKNSAFLYRFISNNALSSLEFLHKINRNNVLAYDDSVEGLWSRLCARYKGAAVIFAELDPVRPVSIEGLENNFDLSNLPKRIDRIYGIVSCSDNARSMSPVVHNKGLRALNIPAIYFPLKISDVKTLSNTIRRLKIIDLPIKGLTITGPMKAKLNRLYHARRDIINRAASANVMIIKNGKTLLDTTDDTGLIRVIKRQNIQISGKKIAVIGCGSSGRVAACTLRDSGADVVLYNRGYDRGEQANKLLKIPFYPLEKTDLNGFDIIVNTAPFSSKKNINCYINKLNSNLIIIDYVYSSQPNSFVIKSKYEGLNAVEGKEMLKIQLIQQFKLLTGERLPPEIILNMDNILNDLSKDKLSFSDFSEPKLSANNRFEINKKMELKLEVA